MNKFLYIVRRMSTTLRSRNSTLRHSVVSTFSSSSRLRGCSKEAFEAALPPPADWICCTRLRHFVKLDLEAPVERYASASFIPGRACCSSTACSALMVGSTMRVAPRAIPSVLTTRCTWTWSSATRMSRRAISRACSGVGTPLVAARQSVLLWLEPELPASSWNAAAASDEVGV
eukprot:scaffold76815_cov57-Phaeocystis_antarctica.AAC.2